jgi:Lon protease-like protein
MMDNDFDLRDFSNVTRLFPLPSLVMFPHVVLPLHIFEPRYRQMMADALADDHLITMIQISPHPQGQQWSEPVPLEDVGCLGRIIQHESLPDGCFNMLLLGLKRVRVHREVATGKLYRTAQVEILHDHAPSHPEEPDRAELVGLFRQLFEHRQGLDPDLAQLLEKAVPLGILTDIVSHALSLPPVLKQFLLSETSVDRRVQTIRSILRKVLAAEGDEHVFPPPFSLN